MNMLCQSRGRTLAVLFLGSLLFLAGGAITTVSSAEKEKGMMEQETMMKKEGMMDKKEEMTDKKESMEKEAMMKKEGMMEEEMMKDKTMEGKKDNMMEQKQ